MAYEKRDCPITIDLMPGGAYYLRVRFVIDGEEMIFWPSSAVAGQFGEFVTALYQLFFENNDGHREERERQMREDPQTHVCTATTRVYWDEEGTWIDVSMSRPQYFDAEKQLNDIHLTFDIHRETDIRKQFVVKDQDLCYAVAKACTDVLKKYGFYGYRYSTGLDHFAIHRLLYIKAFALDAMEVRKLEPCEGKYKTSFEKEMELLLFDM